MFDSFGEFRQLLSLTNDIMRGKTKNLLSAAAIAVAVFFFGFQDASAFNPQGKYRFDLSVSAAAGNPEFATDHLSAGYKTYGNVFCVGNEPTVEQMYADYIDNFRFSGLYSARLEVRPLKHLAYGGDVAFATLKADTYHGLQRDRTGRKQGMMFYLMPQVRYYWYATRMTSMSTGAAVGVGIYSGFEKVVRPEWQIYPLSFTFGRKLYGKGEVSLGSMLLGVSFGIGYRF